MLNINCEICNKKVIFDLVDQKINLLSGNCYHAGNKKEFFTYYKHKNFLRVQIQFEYLNEIYCYVFNNTDNGIEYIKINECKIINLKNDSGEYLKLNYIKKYIDNLCFA